MEQNSNVRQNITPRLEIVREVVRARRIAAWQATKAAMAEAEAQARARKWRQIGEAADDAVAALGRLIERDQLVGQPWGSW